MREEKHPELLSLIDKERPGNKPILGMFQNKARFGHISETRRCCVQDHVAH
jgi:hypothetical protein